MEPDEDTTAALKRPIQSPGPSPDIHANSRADANEDGCSGSTAELIHKNQISLNRNFLGVTAHPQASWCEVRTSKIINFWESLAEGKAARRMIDEKEVYKGAEQEDRDSFIAETASEGPPGEEYGGIA